MKLPPGIQSSFDNELCKLRRSLNGLKQAPRAWFDTVRRVLRQSKCVRSKNDPSVFLRRCSSGITILLVYVDDIIIRGLDLKEIKAIKVILHSSFHMKDLGNLQYFMGLEVHTSKLGIFINQQEYTKDLITLARLYNSTPVDTPLEINVKYRRDEGDLLSDHTIYRRLVGSLLYLTITRPDIAYAVNLTSQFMIAPRHHHMAVVKCIVRYVLGTTQCGLFYSTGSSFICDAYDDKTITLPHVSTELQRADILTKALLRA